VRTRYDRRSLWLVALYGLVLMAHTGHAAMRKLLKAEGIQARVVSMPSWEIFEYYCRHYPEYREHVLPAAVTARVSVEQASTLGWARYVGATGCTIGMETFGASAPLKALQRKFGFTPESIVTAAKAQVAQRR
jgi:transketolase